MFNQFFNQCWAINSSSMMAVCEAVKRVHAGPIEDIQRSGVPVQKSGNTAIVQMKGAMIKDAGFWSYYGFAGTRDTANALKAAAADSDIEQIVWVIDSPGGSVDGLSELADVVRAVNDVKPIYVQVDGMMASAALYAAANASAIYAGRRDLIGSIGTRIMLYDYSEMFNREGIEAVAIDTGEHKSAGAMGLKITDEQKAEFQRIADGYFSDFLATVETGRGMNRKTLESLADGRVFFADEEPLDSGLIDGIQTLDETLATIVQPTQLNRRTAQARLRLLSI